MIKSNGLKFHYEESFSKLEAKRNRQEVLERLSMKRLQNGLKADLNTEAGKAIGNELNRRFRKLYVLREKN